MNPLVEKWFGEQGWTVFDFQRETWDAYLRGESGLVHAPTGMGKTYAVALGPVIEWMREKARATERLPLQVLWITPLRALAGDTAQNVRAALDGIGLPWTVEVRTGDTATSVRQRQRTKPPTVLVTTPENVSLLLSYPDSRPMLSSLRCIVVDEWHELLGTKRGVQTELVLARLRQWNPGLRVWGLSATLGNTEQAMRVLLGPQAAPHGRLISGALSKEISVETILPADPAHFPWAGHMGQVMLPQVVRQIEAAKSTLLFTNTRSQAELWYRALLLERPDWGERLALHHGSLERELRQNVELQLHAGEMKCVVCTSSLDLGVDFAPVDQVIQLGGPKGVARLLQRAGRSGHQPGRVSRIFCVPTQAFELVEFAAAREAIAARDIESRPLMERALDVLVQHLVTVALGSGFEGDAMRAEVRTTHAFHRLTDQEWQWCLDFVTGGGPALRAYPQYAKVVRRGRDYRVESRPIARMHRMSIGTITSDSMLRVQFLKGKMLGTIEESFIARLKPGEAFSFAGHTLELLSVRDMTAYVRRAQRNRPAIPRWMGGRLPLSTELAAAVRRKLDEAKHGRYVGPEMEAVAPVLELQGQWSHIPAPDELLLETTQSKEGFHVFLYPFAGRLVNQGLVALLAYRLARRMPRTIRITANDYGMELLSLQPWSLSDEDWRQAFSTERLTEDLLECLNATEMARRRFRDIARVAGLIFQGYPGAGKSARQLQASSSLFYDVFLRYDPSNRLLDQARREVLEAQLEYSRLKDALEAMQGMRLIVSPTERFSPLAFPIWSEGLQQSQVSSEKWSDRIRRMAVERAAVEEVMNLSIAKTP